MTVPAWATCLMSALESASPVQTGDKKTFSWKQSVPMPSYLIAVAVGELESREISSRCAEEVPLLSVVVDPTALLGTEQRTDLSPQGRGSCCGECGFRTVL